ncbi:tRNA (guanine-N1)-methyltransferase [Spongiimicrobium salis]|uniref:tRNA (guanine-N1)-methyltransferase n=1 Tax=Spongiimicrobium salis TaxID=1667022 RepID=UPI00374CDFEE
MKASRTLLLVIALVTVNLQYAQESNEELSLDKGPISNQLDFIITKSSKWRSEGVPYVVVRVNNLNKLKKNILDSLSVTQKKTGELKTTIAGHESTIESLNAKLDEITNNLNAVTEEKDSMSFLGMLVSKGTYNLSLWSIIGVLFLLLLLFIYRFRRSNILTQEAKTSLSEVETEYEDHRRRALEREQRISRQLQDEINKYKKSK